MTPCTFVATVVLTCLLSPLSLAQDRAQDFANPTIRDFRLDFCRNFGANCGQPAADLFCQELGFDGAAFWLPAGPVEGQTLLSAAGRKPQQSRHSGNHNQIKHRKEDPLRP